MNQSEPESVKSSTPPSVKKYSRKYCKKAKCEFHSSLECQKDLYPANDTKQRNFTNLMDIVIRIVQNSKKILEIKP